MLGLPLTAAAVGWLLAGLFLGYRAGPGWDPVTGWGNPNAQTLVPLLADQARHGATRS